MSTFTFFDYDRAFNADNSFDKTHGLLNIQINDEDVDLTVNQVEDLMSHLQRALDEHNRGGDE